MVLPTNVDSTYADSGTDASVAAHQQHHDTIHAAVNAAAGGATGQVWAKTSSADYAQAWTNPNWGGGDYFRSGYYSHGTHSSGALASLGIAQYYVYTRPFLVPYKRAFDRLGVQVSGVGPANGVIRLGIYTGAGVPTTLLLDAGTVSCATTGAKEVTISQTLDPGIYWLAACAQGDASPNPFIYKYADPRISPWTSAATTAATSLATAGGYFHGPGVTGALPSSYTVAGTTNEIAVMLRAT